MSYEVVSINEFGEVSALRPMSAYNEMYADAPEMHGGWIGECAWMLTHATTEEDRLFWEHELESARRAR